jgi:hypothetical protein
MGLFFTLGASISAERSLRRATKLSKTAHRDRAIRLFDYQEAEIVVESYGSKDA